MKKTMRIVLPVLGALVLLAVVLGVSYMFGLVLTPVLGYPVGDILFWCYTVGASALYWFGVVRGLFWLAETGYFD